MENKDKESVKSNLLGARTLKPGKTQLRCENSLVKNTTLHLHGMAEWNWDFVTT